MSHDVTPDEIIYRTVELAFIAGSIRTRREAFKLIGEFKPEYGPSVLSAFRRVAANRSAVEQARKTSKSENKQIAKEVTHTAS